jgi:hypothetical protein
MAVVQHLSVLAVRALFEGFCTSIGFAAGPAAAEAAVTFLGNRFTDHSARLSDALGRASASAWRALELALAGDSWWDRVKVSLARREDQAFRSQVAAFLAATPLGGLPGCPPEYRQQALRDLRAARQAGLLSAGALDPQDLARRAGPFARFADPQALLDAEWQAALTLADGVRQAGYPALAHFLGLRPHADSPLLVVAVRYFFRREVETDPPLAAALSFARLERLAATQEAGYDALHAALAKSAGRLEDLLAGALQVLAEVNAVVHQTHADVLEVKAALDRQGQHLEAVGNAVFRTLAVQSAAGGEPARKEEDVRLGVLNALLKTPHRRLEEAWPAHEALAARDPRFYVRLAAWYHDKGEVRDHKELFIVALALSPFPGHRDVAAALLEKLPPYQVARVVDFIHGHKETKRVAPAKAGKKKARRPRGVRRVVGEFGLFRNVPRSLRTAVARYLAEREASADWFDGTVMVARKSLKRLYAVLHVRPGRRAQQVLFDDDPPADSRLGALKRIARMTDPDEQARAVESARVPFRVALSLASEKTPRFLQALVERMSPQEVINNLRLLQRHGALADPEVKLMVDLKLEEAKASKRVSALKAGAALAAADLAADVRQKLEEVADVQIKAKGRIRRRTALLVDKSGSMDMAIDVGRQIAAMISAVCEKELYVYAFDTMAYEMSAAGKDWASWKRAFAGVHAGGETSVGVALELMRRRGQAVDQIVIVTDEEEYNPPFFVESLLKYRQALAVDPAVCFVKVPDSTTRLEDQCKRAGVVASVFTFNGDYYSLPNLLALLEPPSELDLLLEIMEFPLPQRG